MIEKKDIGRIIGSKLESKYNDDFFDESKGWDALTGRLPQKGFWDWSFSHFNVYYVSLSLLLIAILTYVTIEPDKKEKTNTTLSVSDPEDDKKAIAPNENTLSPKNKGSYSPHIVLSKGDEATQKDGLNIRRDSMPNLEHLDITPAAVSPKDVIEPVEFKLPPKQIISPENTLPHSIKALDNPKSIKDSITIAQPTTPKQDTIRRRIKRFD